jgi:hypothetical protein
MKPFPRFVDWQMRNSSASEKTFVPNDKPRDKRLLEATFRNRGIRDKQQTLPVKSLKVGRATSLGNLF